MSIHLDERNSCSAAASFSLSRRASSSASTSTSGSSFFLRLVAGFFAIGVASAERVSAAFRFVPRGVALGVEATAGCAGELDAGRARDEELGSCSGSGEKEAAVGSRSGAGEESGSGSAATASWLSLLPSPSLSLVATGVCALDTSAAPASPSSAAACGTSAS